MNTITPYLCCRDAAQAVDFYQRAFGAVELYRLSEPGGRIGHAEISFGGAVVYLSDEYPGFGCAAPSGETNSVTLHLTVPDVDALVRQAAAAGATAVREPKDEFYGHRSATLKDPFGHRWMVSTVIEDLSAEEIQSRYKALASGS
ncbi:MAG: VOC family protein [Bryobacterales bacterium]|jgi:PhnB protein|nr:VOC family protein [Bryobacterales bacterium]